MKACTRCPGQMLVDQGFDGSYWDCMACGHQIDINAHSTGVRSMSTLMNEGGPQLPETRPYLRPKYEVT